MKFQFDFDIVLPSILVTVLDKNKKHAKTHITIFKDQSKTLIKLYGPMEVLLPSKMNHVSFKDGNEANLRKMCQIPSSSPLSIDIPIPLIPDMH